MSLGKQIKIARLSKKLTQTELAQRFNEYSKIYSQKNNVPFKTIGTSAVSNWENEINDPDIDALPILCKVLNVDANKLLELNLISETLYKDDDTQISIIKHPEMDKLPDKVKADILKQALEEKQKMILEETEQVLNIKKELENIEKKD